VQKIEMQNQGSNASAGPIKIPITRDSKHIEETVIQLQELNPDEILYGMAEIGCCDDRVGPLPHTVHSGDTRNLFQRD